MNKISFLKTSSIDPWDIARGLWIPATALAFYKFNKFFILEPETAKMTVSCAVLVNTLVLTTVHTVIKLYWEHVWIEDNEKLKKSKTIENNIQSKSKECQVAQNKFEQEHQAVKKDEQNLIIQRKGIEASIDDLLKDMEQLKKEIQLASGSKKLLIETLETVTLKNLKNYKWKNIDTKSFLSDDGGNIAECINKLNKDKTDINNKLEKTAKRAHDIAEQTPKINNKLDEAGKEKDLHKGLYNAAALSKERAKSNFEAMEKELLKDEETLQKEQGEKEKMEHSRSHLDEIGIKHGTALFNFKTLGVEVDNMDKQLNTLKDERRKLIKNLFEASSEFQTALKPVAEAINIEVQLCQQTFDSWAYDLEERQLNLKKPKQQEAPKEKTPLDFYCEGLNQAYTNCLKIINAAYNVKKTKGTMFPHQHDQWKQENSIEEENIQDVVIDPFLRKCQKTIMDKITFYKRLLKLKKNYDNQLLALKKINDKAPNKNISRIFNSSSASTDNIELSDQDCKSIVEINSEILNLFFNIESISLEGFTFLQKELELLLEAKMKQYSISTSIKELQIEIASKEKELHDKDHAVHLARKKAESLKNEKDKQEQEFEKSQKAYTDKEGLCIHLTDRVDKLKLDVVKEKNLMHKFDEEAKEHKEKWEKYETEIANFHESIYSNEAFLSSYKEKDNALKNEYADLERLITALEAIKKEHEKFQTVSKKYHDKDQERSEKNVDLTLVKGSSSATLDQNKKQRSEALQNFLKSSEELNDAQLEEDRSIISSKHERLGQLEEEKCQLGKELYELKKIDANKSFTDRVARKTADFYRKKAAILSETFAIALAEIKKNLIQQLNKTAFSPAVVENFSPLSAPTTSSASSAYTTTSTTPSSLPEKSTAYFDTNQIQIDLIRSQRERLKMDFSRRASEDDVKKKENAEGVQRLFKQELGLVFKFFYNKMLQEENRKESLSNTQTKTEVYGHCYVNALFVALELVLDQLIFEKSHPKSIKNSTDIKDVLLEIGKLPACEELANFLRQKSIGCGGDEVLLKALKENSKGLYIDFNELNGKLISNYAVTERGFKLNVINLKLKLIQKLEQRPVINAKSNDREYYEEYHKNYAQFKEDKWDLMREIEENELIYLKAKNKKPKTHSDFGGSLEKDPYFDYKYYITYWLPIFAQGVVFWCLPLSLSGRVAQNIMLITTISHLVSRTIFPKPGLKPKNDEKA